MFGLGLLYVFSGYNVLCTVAEYLSSLFICLLSPDLHLKKKHYSVVSVRYLHVLLVKGNFMCSWCSGLELRGDEGGWYPPGMKSCRNHYPCKTAIPAVHPLSSRRNVVDEHGITAI